MLRHLLGETRTHAGAVVTLSLTGDLLGAREAAEFIDAVSALVEDRAVRVVVVDTSGAEFCAGIAAGFDPRELSPDPPSVLAMLRPPVIAAIRGRCGSVGLEIALAADIRIADSDSSFSLADVCSGRLPCWGGTQRLPRVIGHARAAAFLLLGEEWTAELADRAGLVTALASPGQGLSTLVEAEVERLLSVGPLALELAKEAVHRGSELPLRDGLRLEGDLNHLLAATEDRAEGLAAFFAKRPPDFAGR